MCRSARVQRLYTVTVQRVLRLCSACCCLWNCTSLLRLRLVVSLSRACAARRERSPSPASQPPRSRRLYATVSCLALASSPAETPSMRRASVLCASVSSLCARAGASLSCAGLSAVLRGVVTGNCCGSGPGVSCTCSVCLLGIFLSA